MRHTFDIKDSVRAIIMLLLPFLLASCARMGAPDGGWFDEIPPRVVSASPDDRGTNVKSKKVTINFSEFIKVENVAEKVVISPPQMEQPDIKAHGKRIMVELKDSLWQNTTYTIDFSDAISDNNEGNPMGSYTYSFSTGESIDTLEVSGTVLHAENLEPIKGILVGLQGTTPDLPFIRVSRTDSRGRFIIRGVAPGSYTIGAVMDADGDFRFTQRSETMAFSHDSITPYVFGDVRQDTIWADALHIKDIKRVGFQHYMPDNIVLRAFDHEITDRYFLKAERKEADRFTLFFTAPVPKDSVEKLPLLRFLNAPETLASASFNEMFYAEPSLKGDTVTYWLKDSMLINQDTLRFEMMTYMTDTLGNCVMQTDSLVEILSKEPYEKRLKAKNREMEEWQKKIEKKKKKLKEGEVLTATDTIMPRELLKPKYQLEQSMSPDGTIRIEFPTPMQRVDTAAIHLYVEQDSLWYRAPFIIMPVQTSEITQDDTTVVSRQWEIYSDWIPEAEYSFEVDTLAFENIYGLTSGPYKTGLKVKGLNEFASLFVNVQYDGDMLKATADTLATATPAILVQLLDASDKPLRTEKVENGTAEFYYIKPGEYYMRAIIDSNGNGKWDTGDFFLDRQPEEVYYYGEKVECKAKWDLTKAWNLTAKPLEQQKPSGITKQKAEAARQIKSRNSERAAQKGIPVPEKYIMK